MRVSRQFFGGLAGTDSSVGASAALSALYALAALASPGSDADSAPSGAAECVAKLDAALAASRGATDQDPGGAAYAASAATLGRALVFGALRRRGSFLWSGSLLRRGGAAAGGAAAAAAAAAATKEEAAVALLSGDGGDPEAWTGSVVGGALGESSQLTLVALLDLVSSRHPAALLTDPSAAPGKPVGLQIGAPATIKSYEDFFPKKMRRKI